MAFKDKKDPRREMPSWLRKIVGKIGAIKQLHGKEKDTIEQGDEKEEERPDSITRDPEKKGFKGKVTPVSGRRG